MLFRFVSSYNFGPDFGLILQLPDECEWIVWIDPPPLDRVGRALEEMHAGLEASWLKAHRLDRRVMHLTEKNKQLKMKLKKDKDLLDTSEFLIVLVVVILATIVSMWSKNSN